MTNLDRASLEELKEELAYCIAESQTIEGQSHLYRLESQITKINQLIKQKENKMSKLDQMTIPELKAERKRCSDESEAESSWLLLAALADRVSEINQIIEGKERLAKELGTNKAPTRKRNPSSMLGLC